MPKKAKQWVISDFDLTLTKTHTFQERRLELFSTATAESLFKLGRIESSNVKKDNIPKSLFNFDDGNLLSIATYHNNPDYIAGFMSGLLGKKIDFNSLIYKYDNKADIAIKAYKVEGTDKPLLISYLDAQHDNFSSLISTLYGKNEQLFHLSQIARQLNLVDVKTHCDFFEDTETNYQRATQFKDLLKDLPNFNAHLLTENYP